MSNATKIIAVGVGLAAAALAGFGYCHFSNKGKPAPKTEHEIPKKAAGGSDREQLNNTVVTEAPVVPTDKIYSAYTKIREAVEEGKLVAQVEDERVRLIPEINEGGRKVGSLMLTHRPELAVGKAHREEAVIYIDRKGERKFMIVAFQDLVYSMSMLDEHDFFISGPTLVDTNTIAFLEIIMEALVEEFGL